MDAEKDLKDFMFGLIDDLKSDFNKRIDDLKSDLNKRIDNLEKNMNDRAGVTEGKLVSIKSSLEEIERRTGKTETRLNSIEKTLEDYDKRLSAKVNFPMPPDFNSPQQVTVVTRSSVSDPKWGLSSYLGN